MSDGRIGLRKLLSESFALFKGSLFQLSGVVIISFCVFFAVILFLGLCLSVIAAFSAAKFNQSEILASFYDGIFVVFLIIVSVTIFILSTIAMIKIIHAADQGEKIGIFDAFKQARLLSSHYFIAMILATGKILLWSLLLIIPGIIFGTFYSFYSYALVVDGKRGQQALSFSVGIVKPNFWRYLGYNIIVLGMCVILFLILEYGIHRILGVPQKGQLELLPSMGSLILICWQLILNIFTFVFSYMLYKEFKNRIQVEPA